MIKNKERDVVIKPVDNLEVTSYREVHYIPHREVVKEEKLQSSM